MHNTNPVMSFLSMALLTVGLLGCGQNQPTKATAPTPAVAQQASPPAAAVTPQPTAAPPPAAAPTVAPATEGLGEGDGDQTGTKVVINDLKRGGGMVTLKFTIINNSATELSTGMKFTGDGYKENGARGFSGITLVDGVSKKKYFVVQDTDRSCLCSEHVDDMKPNTQASLWAKFPEPPADILKITVVIPHFIPIDDVPIR
jgi:hypothetical protein